MASPHWTFRSAGMKVQLGGVASTWVTTWVWWLCCHTRQAKNVFSTVYVPVVGRPNVSATKPPPPQNNCRAQSGTRRPWKPRNSPW